MANVDQKCCQTVLAERSLFVDDYFHLLPNVMYSPENIPGPGIEIDEFESQLVAGCSCIDGLCNVEPECECIAKYGRNYNQDQRLLGVKYDGPIVECNRTCACNKNRCGNCLVQKGPLKTLEIYDCTAGKGKALRSLCDIEPGTFVCEYAGEVIGIEEGKRRLVSQNVNDMNYIFHLIEHLADGSTIHTFIDPTFIGNIGRYINHSCDPNCFIVPVRTDSPTPRLAIFASCFIPADEEITFDYGSLDKNWSVNNASIKHCLCGKSNCRKFLPYNAQ